MYGDGIELPAEPAPGSASARSINSPPDHEHGGRQGDARRRKVQEFLQLAKKQFMTADAASIGFRTAMRRDQLFAAGGGNQWDTEDKQMRADEGRPCIEINRIPQFIRQVSNQNRANRSQIKVDPRGTGTTRKLAWAIQGLVRGIEVESDADVAYDTGSQHQLTSGMGFIRLRAQWALDDPWTQVCRIGRIRNPLSVYWDPSTQEADFADMRWCDIIGVIGRDEYDEKWGKISSYQSLSDYMAGQRTVDDWAPEGKVLICEHYYVDTEEKTLLRMHDGKSIHKEELPKFRQAYALAHPGEPPAEVIRERQVDVKVVRWCFHNGHDILEGNKDRTAGRELPGTRIPIYPVMGDELDIDGTIDYRGMVRDAIDPQKMYNFWASSIAEAVALAPKAPWVAAKGQIENYLDDWKNANRQPKAALMYDPKAVGDQLVPPPQRSAVEPAIQAMTQGLAEADRDLMSVMGLFQPSLGERGSHSESGKAREALVQQGLVANSNFLDNLQRTKRSIGRSLLEWIPVIYDVPRIVHLLQPDGKKKQAVVYAGEENKPQPGEFTDEDGTDLTEMYNVGVGSFDVTVSTGPSHQTQQQATEAWLLELFKVLPGLAAIGADIVLENSDDPAAQQLAARAKKAIDPKFLDTSDPEAKVPMLEAKLQQAGQLLEKAHAAIGTMAKVIETKELEGDVKKEVAMIAAKAQLDVAMIKAGSDMNTVGFQAEYDRFSEAVQMIHAETVQDMQQDHEARMLAAGQAADQQSQESEQQADQQQQAGEQQHDAGQQASSQQHEQQMQQLAQQHEQQQQQLDRQHALQQQQLTQAHEQQQQAVQQKGDIGKIREQAKLKPKPAAKKKPKK